MPSSTHAGSASEPAAPAHVAVALGSNLGDRHGTLARAVERLRPLVDRLVVSSLHETEPVGVGPQPRFLNSAAVGLTRLGPRALLDGLLSIERSLGRVRPHAGAPRTVDLDLILYGDRIVSEPGLEVPHPRFRDRAFVLDPLVEIAADWVDPVTGLTIAALRRRLALRGG